MAQKYTRNNSGAKRRILGINHGQMYKARHCAKEMENTRVRKVSELLMAKRQAWTKKEKPRFSPKTGRSRMVKSGSLCFFIVRDRVLESPRKV